MSPNRHKKKLIIQVDELWSFVGNKKQKVWLWLALDVTTHLMVGCTLGHRDRETGEDLWYSLPSCYRQWAVCYTDKYPVMKPFYLPNAITPFRKVRE